MHSIRHIFLSILALALLAVSPVALAQVPLQFVPVTPCRVVDTRYAPGPFGGPSIQGQTSRDFAVPESACNIPATAAAYSLNVTAIPHRSLGYMTVWPTGQPKPVLSTLNSADGRVKANAAIVPAGSLNQAVSVYASDTSDVVLDIDGYFAPAGTLAFFPLTPCRVVDTRWPTGTFGGPSLVGRTPRIFPILSSGSCVIPDSAQAYSLNFTAIPKPALGFLTVWPTGQTQPLVSTLNSYTGAITANAAIVPAGQTGYGAISVYATDASDLVIDIDGYFAPANSGPNALLLYNLAPCRLLDTRPSDTFSGMLPVGVLASRCGVPSAQAYVLNATAIPYRSHSLGFLTLYPDAEGLPWVSTLNAPDGAITSNMAIVPTLNGSIDAYASNPSDLVLDISSYFAPVMSLAITTTSLPSATLQYNYSTTLGASGGVPPYTWSVIGSLPPGLNLDSARGLISGMPTITDTYPSTVEVDDSQSPPAAAAALLSITVNPTLTQLAVVTTALPSGTQNAGYSAMLAATGGLTPYTWTISAGSLPAGLNLNSGTGAITGAPSGAGVSNFTVQVSDANSPPATAAAPLSITIAPAVSLSITTSSLPSGTAGTAYSSGLAAIGGVYPYSWSITSGSLPGGLNLNSSTGAITGTPTTAGTSNFTVQVVDSETPPTTVSGQLSLVINPGGGGNPGALTGNYAFYLNGFSPDGAWTLAGSFVSDGHGNITSGVVDGNSVVGQPFNTAVTGTYWIATSGLSTLTIQGQSYGPVTFAFVLSASGNGRIIEYDDTTGQGGRSSGVLRKQDPAAFSLNSLSGGYVFGLTGVAPSGARFVDAGVFNLTSGNITNGVSDINEGGNYVTATFTGSQSTIDAQTGRGVSTIHSSFGDTRHEAIYVVSAAEMVMEQIDPIPGSGIDLALGSVQQQSGSFNNGTLNGTAVMYMQDIHGGDGLDQSEVGIINFDGHGNFNVTAFDENLAGTIQQDQPFQGTYTVQSNGAFALTQTGKSPFPGFLVGQNKAMMVGEGNSTILAIMEPQTGGPFSNASISGTYAGGTLPPLDYAKSRLEVDTGSSDGVGTLTLSDDSSKDGGLGQQLGQAIGYTVASNGRGTSLEQTPAVIYVISPTKVVVLLPEDGAEVIVLAH